MLFRRVTRLYYTVLHLKFVQLRYRIFYRLCKRWVRRQALKPTDGCGVRAWPQRWAAPCVRPQSYWGAGEFAFLGEVSRVDTPSDWNHPAKSKLWLYNLHYLDDLNSVGADTRHDWHVELVEKWINENAPLAGNGWEPYPLSLRLVNLIKWCARQPSVEPHWLASLGRQAQALTAQVEYHILANHLFANGKALVFAGAFLEGVQADNWLRQGLAILDGETREQFLDDGGHFELSPMYHAILLWDICDLVNLANRSGIDELEVRASEWREVIRRGLNWLATMIHPDGEIPFFNDAAFEIAPKLADLKVYATMLGCDMQAGEALACEGALSCRYLEDSGYVAVNIGNNGKALLDLARVGPDYQPGHAHADTLSFELSIGDQRVFVNSGTSEYAEGPERLRQRGTAAHNTLMLDRRDSSEVWGSFRVGRRARVTEAMVATDDDGRVTISGSHDGYRYLPGAPRHRRVWEFFQKKIILTDEVMGKGEHRVEIAFHIHPDCSVVQQDGGAVSIADARGQVLCSLSLEGPGGMEIRPSTYHPEFGCVLENMRMTYQWSGSLPMRWLTRICWEGH